MQVKMRHITASFLLLAARLVLFQVAQAQEAIETAPYTVIKKTQDYEERAYPASSWVCHNSIIQDPALSANSYWPLFGYMSGVNSNSALIPMTSPIAVKMTTGTQVGDWNSEMCFYLPETYQQNPPTPGSDDILLENRPPINVFVRETGGDLTSEQWTSLASELRTVLERAEPAADLSAYYIVGYDPPGSTSNTRNEVWFRKT